MDPAPYLSVAAAFTRRPPLRQPGIEGLAMSRTGALARADGPVLRVPVSIWSLPFAVPGVN